MMIYKALAEVLVTADVALEFARLLLSARLGERGLQQQEPLEIADSGDFWTIVGKAMPNYVGRDRGALVDGRAEIEISKYDGRIWKFAINGHIAP